MIVAAYYPFDQGKGGLFGGYACLSQLSHRFDAFALFITELTLSNCGKS
jgi:hypothetical protein